MTYIVCQYVVISYALSRMKGSCSVDLDIDRNIPLKKRKFDDCNMILPFYSSSRLFVALIPLPVFVLFVTGNTLFDEITQLEISHLKCIHWGGNFSLRVSNSNVYCRYAVAMLSP